MRLVFGGTVIVWLMVFNGLQGVAKADGPSGVAEVENIATVAPEKKAAERCDVPLWSMDPDPSGLNVRSAGKRDAPIKGTLPPETMLTAIDAKNGWFRFKEPMIWNWPEAERIPLETGPKQGWVYGGLLGVDTNCRRDPHGREVLVVYTHPDEASDPVVTWIVGQGFSCDWKIDKPLDCRQGWLKAVLRKGPNAEPVTGWLHRENLCDNPLTTCAG